MNIEDKAIKKIKETYKGGFTQRKNVGDSNQQMVEDVKTRADK